MPVKEEAFYGGAQYHELAAGTYQLRDQGRIVRINATAAGVIMQLPDLRDFRNADAAGGPVFIFHGVTGSATVTVRSPDGTRDITYTAGQRLIANYVPNGSGGWDIQGHVVAVSPAITTMLPNGCLGPGNDPTVDTAGNNQSQHYDTLGDSWTSGTVSATLWRNPSLCSINHSYAYISSDQLKVQNAIVRFSGHGAGSGVWTDTGAKISSTRADGLSGHTDHRYVYMFGGDETRVDQFDTRSWTTVDKGLLMPYTRTQSTSVSMPHVDRIMLFRGLPRLLPPWTFHTPSETFEHLAFQTGVDRTYPTGFPAEQKAHIVHGEDPTESSTVYDTHDVYDPTTRTWSVANVASSEKAEAGGWNVGHRGFISGGYDGTGAIDTSAYYRSGSDDWSSFTKMPSKLGQLSDAGDGTDATAG